jgi:hypothetical protein
VGIVVREGADEPLSLLEATGLGVTVTAVSEALPTYQKDHTCRLFCSQLVTEALMTGSSTRRAARPLPMGRGPDLSPLFGAGKRLS